MLSTPAKTGQSANRFHLLSTGSVLQNLFLASVERGLDKYAALSVWQDVIGKLLKSGKPLLFANDLDPH